MSYPQGLHYGTIKKIIREKYGCNFCNFIEHVRGDDEKWRSVYMIPMKPEEFSRCHQKRIIKSVTNEAGDCIGVYFMVRNYVYKEKGEERVRIEHTIRDEETKVREALYRERNAEAIRQRAKEYYEAHKNDPGFKEKRKVSARELYRRKKGVVTMTEEKARRKEIKEKEVANKKDDRVAELMKKDEAGILSAEEQKELGQLLNSEF